MWMPHGACGRAFRRYPKTVDDHATVPVVLAIHNLVCELHIKRSEFTPHHYYKILLSVCADPEDTAVTDTLN